MTNNPHNTGLQGKVIMRSLGLAGAPPGEGDGSENCWLEHYDPAGGGPDHPGRGFIVWTPDPRRAYVYDDLASAMQAWTQVNPAQPLRPDGKPNRPLTAYSVTFDPPPLDPEHR